MFELSKTSIKENSYQNEMLVRVKVIYSWGSITKWRVEQTKISWKEASFSRNIIQSAPYFFNFYWKKLLMSACLSFADNPFSLIHTDRAHKDIWAPKQDEQLDVLMEPDNRMDKFAVCVKINEKIVRHLKKGTSGRFAKTIFYFLWSDVYSSTWLSSTYPSYPRFDLTSSFCRDNKSSSYPVFELPGVNCISVNYIIKSNSLCERPINILY